MGRLARAGEVIISGILKAPAQRSAAVETPAGSGAGVFTPSRRAMGWRNVREVDFPL
jgi:hypothetical protein